MEFEVSYSLDDEQQFWDELDDIVSAHCPSHALIDNALRSYLSFTTSYKGEYLQSEYDIARCSCKLLESALFAAHKDYVRRQIVYSLLQEDCADTLHLIASFLLFDGRQNEATFEMMNEEGAFPRLLELIRGRIDDEAGLYRMLLQLLYEMSRIQRLRIGDLMLIEDDFITYLFQIIEELSDDVSDPYHYPVIRVLLVLNEQYMVSAHDPGPGESPSIPLTNKVIKTLSSCGSVYKTFGENLILLLNRESETSLQLLILKLLYLLFTTRSTYEYFYTNDLCVLVDVMIRNLLDLPEESGALRHTYLRVLYPLLAHTQLRNPPHYKREELWRLLTMMTNVRSAHFAPVDETTIRLVGRCLRVSWLREDVGGGEAGDVAKKMLGMDLGTARESTLSVLEVAAHREKPGVQTPSREKNVERDKARKDFDWAGDGMMVAAVDNGVTITLNGKALGDEKSPFEVEGEA
ncbi:MAG: hypothetical protein M1830_009173 [Pleopsidium flavum]|nr:MAG: hypothetical protein M1830_009173 [Pleopsidium flavum]